MDLTSKEFKAFHTIAVRNERIIFCKYIKSGFIDQLRWVYKKQIHFFGMCPDAHMHTQKRT